MFYVYVETVPAVVRRNENQVNFKMNNSRKNKNCNQVKQCVHAKKNIKNPYRLFLYRLRFLQKTCLSAGGYTVCTISLKSTEWVRGVRCDGGAGGEAFCRLFRLFVYLPRKG